MKYPIVSTILARMMEKTTGIPRRATKTLFNFSFRFFTSTSFIFSSPPCAIIFHGRDEKIEISVTLLCDFSFRQLGHSHPNFNNNSTDLRWKAEDFSILLYDLPGAFELGYCDILCWKKAQIGVFQSQVEIRTKDSHRVLKRLNFFGKDTAPTLQIRSLGGKVHSVSGGLHGKKSPSTPYHMAWELAL